jgi:hypothetical protein
MAIGFDFDTEIMWYHIPQEELRIQIDKLWNRQISLTEFLAFFHKHGIGAEYLDYQNKHNYKDDVNSWIYEAQDHAAQHTHKLWLEKVFFEPDLKKACDNFKQFDKLLEEQKHVLDFDIEKEPLKHLYLDWKNKTLSTEEVKYRLENLDNFKGGEKDRNKNDKPKVVLR